MLVAAGTGAQTVSIPITGLTPGSTYHYSVTASNVDGNVATPDNSFTPIAQTSPPIGPTSVSAGPDEHSATLASTIDTGANTGTYDLQYGTSTAYGSQTSPQNLTATNGNQQLSAAVTNLAPNTTYHARFVAMVSGYQTSYGSDFTFTTASASPPTITAGPSAATSDSAGDQETITANVDPGTHDTSVSVSYGTTSAYGTTTASTPIPAGSGATSVSIPLTGLNPGTMYHYQLTATNADGSASSVDATFTPTASTAPPIGATSATSGPGQTSVTLGSSIETGGNGGNYVLQYGTDTTYGSQTASQNLTATTGSQPLSGQITGLAPNTTYHARFVATVNGHPVSTGPDDSFTTSGPPSFTAGPTATPASADGTQETIAAPVDAGGEQTTVTVSYGADSSYGTTSTSQTIPANASGQTAQITLTGLTPGTTYHYAVTAANAAGSATTADNTFVATSQTSPAIGSTSVNTGPGETTATIASTIDTGGSGGSYHLQYGTTTGYGQQTPTQNLTATNGSQSLSASLTGLQPNTTYHVQFVAAVNGHPASTGTDLQFTTLPLSPPAFATGGPSATTTSADGTQETIGATVDPGTHDTTVTLSWGATSAYGTTTSATTVPASSGATPVSIPISGLTPGTTYHFQVNATNADGTVHTVDQTFVPTASTHPPVTQPTTAQDPGQTSATLNSSTDTGGNGGTWYIEYGTGTGYGSQTPTQNLTATSASQPLSLALAGLQPATTYHARFVVLVNGYPTSYSSDYTFTTAAAGSGATAGGGSPGTGSPGNPGSPGSGGGGTPGSGGGTPPAKASGAACLAAYVTAPPRTLKLLSIPAGAQLTARRGLRVALARGVKTTGTATFQVTGRHRTRIHGRAFTITRAMLRSGRTSTVRVVIPRRPHRVAVTLRISAAGCGIQLSSAAAGRSLQLRLRLPLGARRVALTLPRAAVSPTAITLATPTGTRTFALTGHGARLRLRRRAGGLRVSARGGSVTVTGLGRSTTGLMLRFPSGAMQGTVSVKVSQFSGGAASARIAIRSR